MGFGIIFALLGLNWLANSVAADDGSGSDPDLSSGDGGENDGTGQLDVHQGDENDNWIDGGFGDDLVFGNEGDDTLLGGLDQGDDVLIDTRGHDSLYGESGDDILVASRIVDDVAVQADLMSMGMYGDLYIPIANSEDMDNDGDYLSGGGGDDTLIFGQNDTAVGGEGKDEFLAGEWVRGKGAATINDYDKSEDKILYLASNVNDVQLSMRPAVETEGDVEILDRGVHVLTLKKAGSAFSLNEIAVVKY